MSDPIRRMAERDVARAEVVDAARQWYRTITGQVISGQALSQAQLRLVAAIEALELME